MFESLGLCLTFQEHQEPLRTDHRTPESINLVIQEVSARRTALAKSFKILTVQFTALRLTTYVTYVNTSVSRSHANVGYQILHKSGEQYLLPVAISIKKHLNRLKYLALAPSTFACKVFINFCRPCIVSQI